MFTVGYIYMFLAGNVSLDYRNYPMFADTLCFRTPPFSPKYLFLASENMFFGKPLFSDPPFSPK